MQKFILLLLLVFASSYSSCSKKAVQSNNSGNISPDSTKFGKVDFWRTDGDQSILLQRQHVVLSFGTKTNSYPFIDIDSSQTFQTIDGFGFTLTGGSASLINQMGSAARDALLKELFGSDSSSIRVSYLRLSIGSSDLNSSVFSYDDLPSGSTDTGLTQFNLGQDTTDLIPLLNQILAINPAIKIVAAPWSAPVWMKDNTSSIGGSLLPLYYKAYAGYFVKYIQQMKAKGITIDAITPQNEPLNPGNNPSMFMTAGEQSNFIKNNLGPLFQSAGIKTKIIVYDHNCDHPDYPLTILGDPSASEYVDGSAFHLYAGDVSALTTVHNAYPLKNIYFTEQYTSSTGAFAGDLKWHLTNVIIGSMNNWSRNALEWNLANDASFGPHTAGGCSTCKGAITISGLSVSRNVAYYIIAHASKFVPGGSVRIASSQAVNLPNVAFETPENKKVLIVVNNDKSPAFFNIRFKGSWVTTNLPAGSVGTYIW